MAVIDDDGELVETPAEEARRRHVLRSAKHVVKRRLEGKCGWGGCPLLVGTFYCVTHGDKVNAAKRARRSAAAKAAKQGKAADVSPPVVAAAPGPERSLAGPGVFPLARLRDRHGQF